MNLALCLWQRGRHRELAIGLTVLLGILAVMSSLGHAQVALMPPAKGSPPRLTAELAEILSWLPPDTESLMVARGRYLAPPAPGNGTGKLIYEPQLIDGKPVYVYRNLATGEVLRSLPPDSPEKFMRLAIQLSGLYRFEMLGDKFTAHLHNQPLRLTISAARRFGPVTGIPGGSPFEGCAILVFDRAIPTGPTNVSPGDILKPDRMAGYSVLRLETSVEWGENKNLTVWLVHPRPHVLLAATDRAFLVTLLERMVRPDKPLAFSEESSDWQNLPTNAQLWGIRHVTDAQLSFIRRSVDATAVGEASAKDSRTSTLSYYLTAGPRPELVMRHRTGETTHEKRFPCDAHSMFIVRWLMGHLLCP